MKIGDLWVKLGLKKEDFSRGMKEAGEEVSGNNGLLGKIKGLKAGAVAAFAAIAAAAVGMADKFAHTSQRLGDQWDQVTAGLKASWRTFVSAVNQTDFSNLGQRLTNAFRNAKEIAASSDLEFEVMNSINLRKAEMSQELENLRILMQSQKLSQRERITAANEYLEKLRPIYAQEEAYRKSHAEKMKKAYLEGAGLDYNDWNSQYLRDFLVNIAPNSTLTDALYNFSRNGWGNSDLEDRLLKQLLGQYGGNESALVSLGKIANYYRNTADQDIRPVVDAITAAQYAAGAFDQETRRVQNIANQIESGGGGDAGRKQAQSILKRAQDAAKGELQIMMEKYEEEKALLKQYGLDIQPLWEEMLDNMRESFDVKLSKLTVDIDFEVDDIDMSEVDAEIQRQADSLLVDMQRKADLVQQTMEELRSAIVSGFEDSCQEIFNQLTGLEEINPGRIVQALLTPLADMAIKAGEVIIAEGVAVEAAKAALETFEGYGAIAAGGLLIAAGAAAKAGLAALASSGGRTTATSTAANSSSAGGTQDFKTEMTVYVKGTIRGSDIVLSGQKTVNNWGR